VTDIEASKAANFRFGPGALQIIDSFFAYFILPEKCAVFTLQLA
jgi:hypothetical protein